MPIIPRYQPRGGPRVQGLDYAGAYQPPSGDDWRMLARAMDTFAPYAQKAHEHLHRPRGDAPPPPEPSPQEGAAGPTQVQPPRSAAIEGKTQDVVWRRQLLDNGNSGGVQAVMASRQAAREGLGPEAAAWFDGMTEPREAGFLADAAAREAAALRARAFELSEQRQAVGVDEFQLLFDSAPEQANAALGSAVRELGGRLRQSGLDEADVVAAQRMLVSTAHSERIDRALGEDVAHARHLLENTNAVVETDRRRLMQDVEAEERRLSVRNEAATQAAGLPDLTDNPEPLYQWARQAAGGDPELDELYAGAAMAEVRGARTLRAAREEQAWTALTPFLEKGDLRSWTDLPAPVWKALSQSQKLRVLDAIEGAAAVETREPLPQVVQAMIEPQPDQAVWPAGEDARLIRTGWSAQTTPLASAPFDPSDRQSWMSPQDKALNLALSNISADDGLFVNAETGQVMRHRLGRWPTPSLKDGGVEAEVVTNYEAQQFRERRLGALSHKAGVMSPQEETYRRLLLKGFDSQPIPVSERMRPLPEVFAPRNYRLQPGDEVLLARMIFSEGSNTSEDHEALGWSILNRIGHPEHGDSLTAVLEDPKGFQIVPEGGGPPGGSPQWRLSGKPETMNPIDRRSWENAKRVANGILTGRIPDPVKGGRFFYSSTTPFDGRPETVLKGWYRDAVKAGKIVPAPYSSRAKGNVKNYFFKDK